MQEQIDGRVIDVMRKLQREAQDDEYESSTQGADAWRERVAQRHRFGRVLDEPEVHDDREEARWLVWFALYLAVVVVALVVIWLVAA
jgi:hypothetical protein